MRTPRLIAFIVLLACCGSRSSLIDACGEEPPLRVFLLAGQSNMVGADAHADRIDQYPPFLGVGQPQDDVLFAYAVGGAAAPAQRWSPLRPLGSFGPELTFARRVKQQSPGPIAIIKSAVGGTTVAYDWNPDAPERGQKLYPRTLELVRQSLEDLSRRNIRYRLEAVLWHQGENDMLDKKLYPTYADGLTRLITRLRADLQMPNLPWYLAETSEKGIWGMDHRANLAGLRAQQEQVLRTVPNTYWVPTSHLAFEVMGSAQPHYHFGTQGQLQLGEAFADAYLRNVGPKTAAAPTNAPFTLPFPAKAPVRLFVLAGQRNMEGEDAFVDQLAKDPNYAPLTRPQSDIAYRYSLGGGVKVAADWQPLGPIDYLGGFGPELSLGAALRKAINAKEGVAIVKFTHSGAQGPDWQPDGSPESNRNLYTKWIAFLKDARKDLTDRGYNCQLAGVFWHTGENDTFFGPYAQNHSRWIKHLIERTRIDLEQPELAWFVSEQHEDSPWRNNASVNQALRDLTRADSKLRIIPTDDLTHGKNLFGTVGIVQLGETYAKAYLDSQ